MVSYLFAGLLEGEYHCRQLRYKLDSIFVVDLQQALFLGEAETYKN